MQADAKKVLVVDDDESAREFVSAIMTAEGWQTLEAHNGVEALDMVENFEPNLIILDITMPEMDGFETFKRLRKNHFTKNIPVIMLTAINEVDPETRHNEFTVEERLGVERPEGFVDKPVDPVFLLNTVFGVVG